MRTRQIAVLAASLLFAAKDVSGADPQHELQGITTVDALEMGRFMPGKIGAERSNDGSLRVTQEHVLRSPDGKRYVVILVRGDVQRDGNWFELLGGGLESFAAAARIESIALLFTRSFGSSYGGFDSSNLTLPVWNPIRWLNDSETVTFLFGDGTEPIQATAVNVKTKLVRKLTSSRTDVTSVAVAPNGTIVYEAKVAHASTQSAQMLRDGFAVVNDFVWDVLRGEVDGYDQLDRVFNRERWISTPESPEPRVIAFDGRTLQSFYSLSTTAFSPDSRYAIMDGTPSDYPPEWTNYKDDFLQLGMAEAMRGGRGPAVRQIRQLFVADLTQGTARPLWKAPLASSSQIAWSPTGRSVVIGPTYLPVSERSQDGLAGTAVAEVDIDTGRVVQVPLTSLHAGGGIDELRWLDQNRIEVVSNGRRLRFVRADRGWLERRNDAKNTVRPPKLQIEVEQDLNTPPRLVARDSRSNKRSTVLDPNPRLLSRYALGQVKEISWPDKERRVWKGLLYLPVGYRPDRQYPLVVQTHGYAPKEEFSLYGFGPFVPGLGASYGPYAAQILAGRGIAVLQVEDKNVPGVDLSPGEPEMYMRAYEAGVGHLVDSGVVRRDKVGILGFSRTGWYVEYALTHSEFPYAAALCADNIDGNYSRSFFQWADEYEKDIGALPFGSGLKAWLERSPAFNVERVTAPVRLQKDSGALQGVLDQWEFFSRLKQLRKPVELYVVPNIDLHGSHGLQNPRQVIASKEGAVDWFDFWLNGNEDLRSDKFEQYARWRKLRELHVVP